MCILRNEKTRFATRATGKQRCWFGVCGLAKKHEISRDLRFSRETNSAPLRSGRLPAQKHVTILAYVDPCEPSCRPRKKAVPEINFFFCWPKTLRQLKCAPLINKRRTLNHMPNRTHHVLHLGNLPCCCRVSLFQVLCIYHPKSYPCSGINFAFLLGTTGKGLRNLFKVFVGKKHFEVCWNGFRS